MAAARNWDQPAILAEIRRRGSSISELSREAGLNRGTLYSAFYKRYPKGQALIATFLGASRHEIWPHWYGPNDELLPLQGARGRAA
ncbi:helix-turn-helix domain-containing protein [Methylobacterium radiotolerans]|jgi:Ner family transcriptional regulator|uniref:helix-turn-helix domain-containing protein n=1 Tax=Methylobacterium radiotolerans TaxID=31998 RepID=UPI001F326C39|nr:helix-turn-helix domain-containing protein [Methylobacterium radiotolerans]UIY44104.1 helix-turn-helix domain-containing protein [Methylobacterium radiotolerans]